MNKLNKVAAIIVSYNDADGVSVCIRALKLQVHLIIVVDNGSNSDCVSKLRALKSDPAVTLVESPINLGIGAAINLALAHRDTADTDWILTMDQDSIAAPDMIQKMLQTANYYPRAVFTPEIADLGHADHDSLPIEVDYAITSGNLIPATAMRRLKAFNTDLFIDGVDFDFSLRLRRAGYRIFRVPGARMFHSLGQITIGIRPKRFYTNHPPLRRYYTARNLILNLRRHALHFPVFFVRLFFVWVLSFVNLLIWGPKRFESVRMILRGLLDGVLNRSGVYVRD